MLDSFNPIHQSELVGKTLGMLLLFIYIGLGVFVSGWCMVAAWLITGERQSI
jgi:hypothetical protein